MNENFRSLDFSVTAPVLRRSLSEPILRALPFSVSPHSLTLIGGVCAGFTALILWTLPDLLLSETIFGKSLLLLSSLFLVIYAVCDQLDGLQARRAKRGSSEGDFLDHWVDALIANLIPAALMLVLGYQLIEIAVMLIVVALAWWANNWETTNQSERRLPFIGGLEFIWVGVIILSLTAFFGISIWDQRVLGVSLRDITYWLVLAALIIAIAKNVYRTPSRISDFITPTASLLPICFWLLAHWEAKLGTEIDRNIAFLVIGLMSVKHTGDLIRHLWLDISHRRIEIVFLALGGGLYAFGSLLPDQIAGVQLITLYLAGWAAFLSVLLAWQSVQSFVEISHKQPVNSRNSEGPGRKRIMVDMSATLLHHGHIRLLRQASELGYVIVGLTNDDDLRVVKKLEPELEFSHRKEILEALQYVDEVVETPWLLTEETLAQHEIDLLIHGDDNQNPIQPDKLLVLPRTSGVSTELIRERAAANYRLR